MRPRTDQSFRSTELFPQGLGHHRQRHRYRYLHCGLHLQRRPKNIYERRQDLKSRTSGGRATEKAFVVRRPCIVQDKLRAIKAADNDRSFLDSNNLIARYIQKITILLCEPKRQSSDRSRSMIILCIYQNSIKYEFMTLHHIDKSQSEYGTGSIRKISLTKIADIVGTGGSTGLSRRQKRKRS